MKKIILVLPVYNEERILKESSLKVMNFCDKNLKNYNWQILIADNGSTDETPKIAKELAKNYQQIINFSIPEKGRGYALKKAWLEEFQADIYTYMDSDLSSDLNAFPLLIKAIDQENYQIAIGSRLKYGHQTKRSFGRELLSRGYNLMLRTLFHPSFEDAQCGFKAITKEAAKKLLPKIKNNNWFFDTEMLILADHFGLKIKEIPIEWLETRVIQRKSTVKILATVWEDIKGMIELKLRLKKL